ncbi:Protein SUPPRESSOR OF npr1-1, CONSTITUTIVE 1, partial [Mucuna pruriens]
MCGDSVKGRLSQAWTQWSRPVSAWSHAGMAQELKIGPTLGKAGTTFQLGQFWVLNANKADEIYRLTELSFNEAFELFKLIAFHRCDHQREYDLLSERMVHYAKGVPLVLKVLAHRLHGKNKEIWKSELVKLEKMLPTEVYEVMKMSYDDLDRKEQQFFLDLACFVLRLHRKVNVGNLKSLLKDGESDNSVVAVLERLKDKALITFSEDNFICMHDSLQEMGLEIVRQQSSKHPGSGSWLWDPDYICEALKNDNGTGAIRSIQIDLTKLKQLKFSPQIFAKMSRLQFLEIYSASNHDNSLAEEGLEKFSVEKFVILRLPFSRTKKLWDGVKNLVNLKELDLNSSQMLEELPDLSKATNLEVLILWGCSMLTALHSSIFSLAKLKKLDLWNCKSLTTVANYYHLLGNRYLTHDDCKNLREFSQMSKNISLFGDLLNVTERDLERLPSCFNNLMQLLHLDVSNCTKLQTIPELPQYLKTLYVRNCNSLESLPELPLSLEKLATPFCKLLLTLPELPQLIEILDVRHCNSLQTLPELPSSLKTLDAQYCESLQTLPELPQVIKTLNVRHCTLLQTLSKLPSSLKTLETQYCESLQTLLELSQLIETLDVRHCNSLQTLPKLPSSLKTLEAQYCESLQTLPQLPQLIETLDVRHCNSLQTLPELPSSLKTLNAQHCESLQTLPELPQLIKTLNVRHCTSLQTLQKLPSSLKSLYAQYCESLQNLPELPELIETLNVQYCKSLQTLPQFPPSLQRLRANNCKSLESLPKFSHSLEFLDVSGCESLKSVLFPSTAVEQLKGNRRWVQFRDCFNLEEHSLGAIELNAQINIMKFANQHLSTPSHHHVKLHVPEWLEYKTTEDNVIIDLSFAPPSPFLDFIFCFVFVTISGEGEGEKDRKYMDYLWEDPIESDHVCVVYYKGKFDFLISRAENETRFKIQVKIESDYAMAEEVLKGFGAASHIAVSLNKWNCVTQCITSIKQKDSSQ